MGPLVLLLLMVLVEGIIFNDPAAMESHRQSLYCVDYFLYDFIFKISR
jgi:hypothetical protein